MVRFRVDSTTVTSTSTVTSNHNTVNKPFEKPKESALIDELSRLF